MQMNFEQLLTAEFAKLKEAFTRSENEAKLQLKTLTDSKDESQSFKLRFNFIQQI